MLVVLALQADQLDVVPRLLLALGPRDAAHAHAEFDIAQCRQPAVERIVALEDHAPVGGRAGDRLAGDADVARAHLFETRHHVEHGGLAAAAGAQQAEEFTGLDVEGEVAGPDVVAALQRPIDLADLREPNARHGPALPRRPARRSRKGSAVPGKTVIRCRRTFGRCAGRRPAARHRRRIRAAPRTDGRARPGSFLERAVIAVLDRRPTAPASTR